MLFYLPIFSSERLALNTQTDDALSEVVEILRTRYSSRARSGKYLKLNVCDERKKKEKEIKLGKIRCCRARVSAIQATPYMSLRSHYRRVSVRRPSLQPPERKKRRAPCAIFFYCHERPLVPNPGQDHRVLANSARIRVCSDHEIMRENPSFQCPKLWNVNVIGDVDKYIYSILS